MSRAVRLQIIAIAAALCVVLMMSHAQANPVNIVPATETQKSDTTTAAPITQSSTEKSKPVCEKERQPCGWAVYGTGKRTEIQYFIQNTCRCNKPLQKCLLDGEDLSLSAYVYRCKDRSELPSAP